MVRRELGGLGPVVFLRHTVQRCDALALLDVGQLVLPSVRRPMRGLGLGLSIKEVGNVLAPRSDTFLILRGPTSIG